MLQSAYTVEYTPLATTPTALPDLNPNSDNLESSNNGEHVNWPPVARFNQLREPLIDDTPENVHP